ncbi:hypothetical protein LTR53_002181 [Teratosphaeriaceae sp. CCFEE 6253]|nr:hypothetical protein LTR53_002181 [Teratosphaeriaceae sp. CCFEE 6253]
MAHPPSAPDSGNPSRTPSSWSKIEEEDKDTPESASPDTRSEVVQEKEPRDSQLGRVVGGKYSENDNATTAPDGRIHGPLTQVDIDMPLTFTELVFKNGREYIVLSFADGDKENPFNWNAWYKRGITTMLNLMTLFIGLATTAYSSGINSMCAEFGVSTELGQLGLFTFVRCSAIDVLDGGLDIWGGLGTSKRLNFGRS